MGGADLYAEHVCRRRPDVESAVVGDMFAVMRLTMQAQRNLDDIATPKIDGAVRPEALITYAEALL